MARPTWITIVPAVLAGCRFDAGAPTPQLADAPPPDAAVAPRPLGGVDGECAGRPGAPRVLVYTYENLWRHMSNLFARGAAFDMCTSRGFAVTSTNDPRAINATRLASVDVIVFALPSGEGMDDAAKVDLEAWIRAGGGVVGLESTAATERTWPFFADNLGAAFAGHPPGLQTASVRVENTGHPIMAGLPAAFELTDQWYVFDRRPEDVPGIDVLLTLDETTLPADFPAEYLRGFHAIGWAHDRFGGRVFYTGLGDNPDDFADDTFVALIGNAIEWAAHRR